MVKLVLVVISWINRLPAEFRWVDRDYKGWSFDSRQKRGAGLFDPAPLSFQCGVPLKELTLPPTTLFGRIVFRCLSCGRRRFY